MKRLSWHVRREIAEAKDLLRAFEPLVAEVVERRRKEAAREFASYRPRWEIAVAAHRWRRSLEGGLVELPQRFLGHYALATDRYAAIGGGVDMVAARVKFGREVMEAAAPCIHAAKYLGQRAFILAVESGCSCDSHSPEIEFTAPLEDIDKMFKNFRESGDSDPF
jgi:hypothetical protein